MDEIEHKHCTRYDCEHPQPFYILPNTALTIDERHAGLEPGKHYCGCCWYRYRLASEMVDCTPDVCD